jgi:hypothetical protein
MRIASPAGGPAEQGRLLAGQMDPHARRFRIVPIRSKHLAPSGDYRPGVYLQLGLEP